MKNLAEYILEALKKGVKVKMRNAIDGTDGEEFDAVVLCNEFQLPANVNIMEYESFVFVRLKNKPSYLSNDVHLAILDDYGWSFDPTFWETVGDDIKYYEKALAQAGLKAEWNDKGYYVTVSK